MKFFTTRIVYQTFLFFCVCSMPLWAGITGRIQGKVTDKETGDPLPGATIRIEGNLRTGTTNAQGEFLILGIDAGTYLISAQLTGYVKVSYAGFGVFPDVQNEINFELPPDGVQGEDILLDAETVSRLADDPYMRQPVMAKTFDRRPNRSLNDIVLQSSGDIYQRRIIPSLPLAERFMRNDELFFRGGSAREAGHYLDGLRLTDGNTGANFLSLPYGALDQVIIQSGGYDSKYGQFATGMIQIVPKRGGTTFASSAEIVTDAVASGFGSESYGQNTFRFTFGGPIISDQARIFMALDYVEFEDAEPGVFGHPVVRFNTRGIRNPDPSINDTAIFATHENGDLKVTRGARPNRVNEESQTNFYANLSYALNADLQFDLTTIYAATERNQYRTQSLLAPRGVPRQERSTYLVDVSGKYFLSRNMFLQAHIGTYASDDKVTARRFFDMGDQALDIFIESIWGNTGSTTYYGDNLLLDIDREYLMFKKSESEAWSGGTSINWQLNKAHFIESGVGFSSHSERLFNLTDLYPYGANNIYGYRVGYDNQHRVFIAQQNKDDKVNMFDGPKKPFTLAFFAQDKYSVERFTFSGGLRADYFSNGMKRIDFPDVEYLLQAGSFSLFKTNENVREIPALTESKSYIKWSPRLALTTEFNRNISAHANYGWYYHIPAFENHLIGSHLMYQMISSMPFQQTLPNFILNPEKTEATELGLLYNTIELSLDVSFFRNSTSGLIMAGTQPFTAPVGAFGPTQGTLWTLENSGSRIVTGLNLRFEDRVSGNLAVGAYATFLNSRTTTSELSSGFRSDWLMEEVPQVEASSDHEQETTIRLFADMRLLKGEGPVIAGGRPLQNTNLFVWVNRSSGFPYTPTAVTRYTLISSGTTVLTGERNSRTTPQTITVDVKFAKQFDIADSYHATFYVEILNLLNRKNPIQVFSATGKADSDGFLGTPAAQSMTRRELQQYQYLMKNSLNYSNPRLVNVGLKVDF